MADWYTSSVKYALVTAWAASTAYSVGVFRKQTAPTAGNERVFRCSVAGTSGAAEPTWIITKAGSTTDNTVTWVEVTGNSTYNSGATWSAPLLRLANAMSWMAAGDTCYVASNHIETSTTAATSIAVTLPGTNTAPCRLISIDPAQATLTYQVGALISMTTGNTGRSVNLNGTGYVAGVGISGSVTYTSFGVGTSSSSTLHCRDVDMFESGGGNNSRVLGNGNGTRVVLRGFNTRYTGGGTYYQIAGHVDWEGGTAFSNNSVNSGGAFFMAGYGSMATIRNVDFSALSSGKTLFSGSSNGMFSVSLSGCKISSGVIIQGANNFVGSQITDMVGTDSGGSILRGERYMQGASQITDTAVVATGGTNDGTTGFSWKLATPATLWPSQPFQCQQFVVWNALTGAAKTPSVEGIINAAAVPNNLDIYFLVKYLGTAGSTLQSSVRGGVSSVIAATAAWAASSTSWDSAATARVSSGSAVLGQVIKTASNAGRVFFCTTAGTMATGAEPAGYAAAVDGGVVNESTGGGTPGTAVFRAGCRFTMSSAAITPQVAGPVTVEVLVTAASATIYISPQIILS